jgi:uncharacterized phage protein gp47/JayE
MSFGITDQGFVLKTQDDILQELTDAAVLPEYFGPTQDLTIYDPVGQFLNIIAKALANTWEGLEDAYYAFYIDVAEGVSLDRAVALGGMTRITAQKATVTVSASGTNGTVVLAGDLLAQTSQAVQFENISTGTVVNGVVDLTFRAVVAGESGIVAAESINELVNPFSGITGVGNRLASTGGTEIETDADLRTRFNERGSSGGSSIPAIISKLQEVTGVTRANVVENATNGTVDGRNAHSIECVVAGTGSDVDIATAIFNTKPAGIEPVGSKSFAVADDNGDSHTMKWTVPTEKLVNVVINVTSNSAWVTANIATLKTRVIEIIGGVDTVGSVSTEYDGLDSGEDVYAWQLIANFDDITGMDDVEVFLAFSPTTPTALKTLSVDYDEYARCDTANVTVNVA